MASANLAGSGGIDDQAVVGDQFVDAFATCAHDGQGRRPIASSMALLMPLLGAGA